MAVAAFAAAFAPNIGCPVMFVLPLAFSCMQTKLEIPSAIPLPLCRAHGIDPEG